MRCLSFAVPFMAVALTACLDELPLDEPFPCREPADCVEGFVCHPTRFVCVSESENSSVDAGTSDSGTSESDSGT